MACMKGNEQLTKWFVFNINKSNEESSKSGHEMGKQSRPVWLMVQLSAGLRRNRAARFSEQVLQLIQLALKSWRSFLLAQLNVIVGP